MEYIISNFEIPGLSKLDQLYIKGDFGQHEGYASLIEGEIFGDKIKDNQDNKNIDTFLKDCPLGVYNLIKLTPSHITIKNDKIGRYQLYYYIKDDKFIISNNIWKIIQNITPEFINKNLAAFILLDKIPTPGDTFIENIKVLTSASELSIDTSTVTKKLTPYWKLNQQEDKTKDINDAVLSLDKAINLTFKKLKEQYPNETFYFGNSGGLDSRLVPIYAKQNNIKISGFNIGLKRSKFGFKTQAHINSKRVAKMYGFETKMISPYSKNYSERMLLDIRNNPISNNQIFKNPYNQLKESNLMFCGANGYMISNDNGMWEKFNNLKTTGEKKNFLRDFFSKISSFPQETQDHILSLFPESQVKSFQNDLDQFIDINKGNGNISTIRSFHQMILNKPGGTGGFESINGTKKSFLLYYPYAFEESLSWTRSFFYNRQLLNKLLELKDGNLASIRDQKSRKINSQKTSLYLRIIRRLRGNGLDYSTWVKEKAFLAYLNTILDRENPLVKQLKLDKVLTYDVCKSTNFFITLDILKLKSILDIIHYEEYDLIENKEFFLQ